MMDLVILGIFAFWIGKNFDGFDLDFSQNPQKPKPIPYENPDKPKLPSDNEKWVVLDSFPSQKADEQGVIYTLEGKKFYRISGGSRIDNTPDAQGNNTVVNYKPYIITLIGVHYRVLKDGVITPINPNVVTNAYESNGITNILDTEGYNNMLRKAESLAQARTQGEQEYYDASDEEKQRMKDEELERQRQESQGDGREYSDMSKSKGGAF